MKTIEETCPKTMAVLNNVFGGNYEYGKQMLLNINNARYNNPVIFDGVEGTGKSVFGRILYKIMKDEIYSLGDYELFSEYNSCMENISLLYLDNIDLLDYHSAAKVRKIMSEQWYTLRRVEKTDQVREKNFSTILCSNGVQDIDILKNEGYHIFTSTRSLKEVIEEDFYMDMDTFFEELFQEDVSPYLIVKIKHVETIDSLERKAEFLANHGINVPVVKDNELF